MTVESWSYVLRVVGSNPCTSYCLLPWGKLGQLPVRLQLVGGLSLRTWFVVFEARLSCGGKMQAVRNGSD